MGKNKSKKTQGAPGGRTSRRGLGGALIIYNMLGAPPSLEMILWTFLWRRRCDVCTPLARSVATLSWVHGGSRSGARHPAWAGRTTKEEATPQASQLLTIAAELRRLGALAVRRDGTIASSVGPGVEG